MASIANTLNAAAPQAPRTATDFVGLAEMRAQAGRDAGTVTPEAARQFEALFVQMMLQSMRAAGDVFGDGSDTTYRDMFDQQIAMEMTRGKGLGLATVLTRQLAPQADPAAAALRAPADRDTVMALGKAPPSLPQARFDLASPEAGDLAALAMQPSLDLPNEPATTTGATTRPWNDWRPGTPEEFIRDVLPHAEAAGRELGVDPRAIIAQAALETGWGRNVARDATGVSGNNPFNIKADAGWTGGRVSVRTLEFEDGLPKQKVAAFRAYPDLESAFSDYVQFLKSNPRYADALRQGAQPGKFADALQSAGYATDPSYAEKLRSILGGPRLNDMIGKLKNLVGVPTL
jgi:flagellar protein FlgJ